METLVGFFRKEGKASFWHSPPFQNKDPQVLYQHGITCVTRSDGAGMMRTGWALWGIGGLHQHLAWNFLTDGFQQWRTSADPATARAFVEDVFARATASTPHFPPDIYSVPRELVEPASAVFGARCWAGMRLIELARHAGDEAAAQMAAARLRAALQGAHPAFLTGEAASFLRA
jgi:hypothetical protein